MGSQIFWDLWGYKIAVSKGLKIENLPLKICYICFIVEGILRGQQHIPSKN